MIEMELRNSIRTLKNQQVFLYPTDTVWGIGCDATSEAAVAKVFKIKQRSESKSLIILVDGIEMLQQYIPSISEDVLNLLASTKKPTTIIYNNPVGLANNVVASDNTVAIRIPQNEFCKQLISKFGKPIVSTSANISDEATPRYFSEINESILDSVDHIVNLDKEKINSGSSSIIQIMDDNTIKVIRN